MFKTAATRWTETIDYLNTKFPHDRLGDHINTIVVNGRSQISGEIALGSSNAVHKNTAANKGARDALRALLLCQRVYFSDLWAKTTFRGGVTFPDTISLVGDWKAQSLSAWGRRDEASILSAVGMFATVPGATAADVSDVAKTGPPSGKAPPIAGNLRVSRQDFPLTGAAETCYRGVLAWLLKSGVISFRWFMQNSAPSGSNALNELFGAGVDVWSGTPFWEISVLPQVEKGFVVHMWMEDSGEGGWNGHWVISNGDGTICGVNNGEVNLPDERVLKAYTNDGTLRTQFEGYTELVREVPNARGFMDIVHVGQARARMVKFDPLALRNRM